MASLLLGAGIGLASLLLGIVGWELSRLWLYYLGSASFALIGLQLVIAWVQMQVLVALSERESLIVDDLRGKEAKTVANQDRATGPAVKVQETYSHG